MRAQLLGFVIFADSGSVRVQAFGSDAEGPSEAEWERLLPGPHPILRCLLGIDAGAGFLQGIVSTRAACVCLAVML